MIEGSIGMRNGGWLGAMKRGLRRCPRCAPGGMFTGYLVVAKTAIAGLDFDPSAPTMWRPISPS
jgi:uncharacterized protein (DUF983 family)